jgi:Ca2+/Na+ antiporter
MPDSPHVTLAVSREQLKVFRMLYPLFKKEVFRRRENMIRLSAFHHAVMLFLLVTFLVFPFDQASSSATQWLAMTGIALFSGFFAYVILQQAHRHRMAKQQLIALEQEMGLYKEGWLFSGKAAYPEHWQTDWRTDGSITIYLVVLTSLSALVMGAILIRP